MAAISLVDSKGLVTPLRYRRSQGITAGTAVVGVGITALSITFAIVLAVVHYVLYNSELGFLGSILPILLVTYYAAVLPPIVCTAFIGVVLLHGFATMLRKRMAAGTDAPGRLEAPTRQPLEIDMEIYVWEKLRNLALKTHIHFVSELAGLVGGPPTGIFFGGIIMLFRLWEPGVGARLPPAFNDHINKLAPAAANWGF